MNPCCRRAVLAERRAIRENVWRDIEIAMKHGWKNTTVRFSFALSVIEEEWRLQDKRPAREAREE